MPSCVGYLLGDVIASACGKADVVASVFGEYAFIAAPTMTAVRHDGDGRPEKVVDKFLFVCHV